MAAAVNFEIHWVMCVTVHLWVWASALYADSCESCDSCFSVLYRLVLIGATHLKPVESKRVDIYVWSTACQTYFKVL